MISFLENSDPLTLCAQCHCYWWPDDTGSQGNSNQQPWYWPTFKQKHIVVKYFPCYFTRRPARKPRPRRESGFHAGSPSEEHGNSQLQMFFFSHGYFHLYKYRYITLINYLPKYNFEPCRLQVLRHIWQIFCFCLATLSAHIWLWRHVAMNYVTKEPFEGFSLRYFIQRITC